MRTILSLQPKTFLQRYEMQKKQVNFFKFKNLSLKEAIQNLEKKLLVEHLQKQRGNKTKAAKSLGISRTSILSKVKEYNLTDYDEVS